MDIPTLMSRQVASMSFSCGAVVRKRPRKTSEGVRSPLYAESPGILAPKGLDSIAQGAALGTYNSTDQGPTGRHPLAVWSDGPWGLEECLASDFPGLRPGLSSQAPWGPKCENLHRIATTARDFRSLRRLRKTSEECGRHSTQLLTPRPQQGLTRKPRAQPWEIGSQTFLKAQRAVTRLRQRVTARWVLIG